VSLGRTIRGGPSEKVQSPVSDACRRAGTVVTLTLAGALLDSLGLGPPAATMLGPPSLLTWPAGAWTLTQGSVQTTAGGWDRTASPSPRVFVAAGPEVSQRGVGAAVRTCLAAMPAPGSLPDRRRRAHHLDGLPLMPAPS
jgi:hypothetical protein